MKRAYWSCSYLPREIPTAFGYLPRRFWAQAGATPRADRFFPPNLCSGVRAALEEVLRQSGEDDLFLLTDCCAAGRRLGDALQACLPDRTFLMDLPHNDAGVKRMATELQRLAFFLAKKSAQGRTDDELRQAIVQANEKRRAWRELQDRKARGLLSPLGYKSAIRAHSVGEDPPAWEDAPRSGRIPILLLGNSLDLESTWRMLEELGFIVVADDLCYGEKMDSEEVEEDGDPFLALSKAALARPPCPRTLQLAERWEDLLAKARSRSARGAILFPTKYCDYYAYEIPILIPLLRKGGLATLVLEMDYGQVSPEQLRTRLEAFRESL